MAEEGEKPSVSEWGRVRNTTVVKPIVYGSQARYFTQKKDNGHTHAWKIFLRSYYAEDTTKWIRKVTFKLHESIQNATRVIERPPYEVSETGWGEFEVIIRIYFVDPQEKPITAYHVLKLFQNDPMCMAGKKPVISEYYDEIVFNEPSQLMLTALQSTGKTKKFMAHDTDFENKKEKVVTSIAKARGEVRAEIEDFKESLKDARTLIQKYTAQLVKHEAENAESDPAQEIP